MLECWSILLKIERNSQLMKVDRFLFGKANMAKIYERSMSTIIAQGKFMTRSIPEVKLCRARRVLGRVTRLEIPRVLDCFSFFFITRLTCFGCFKTDVLFCQASVKIKFSTLSVHCYITFMLSSTEKCLACFPQCLLRTF